MANLTKKQLEELLKPTGTGMVGIKILENANKNTSVPVATPVPTPAPPVATRNTHGGMGFTDSDIQKMATTTSLKEKFLDAIKAANSVSQGFVSGNSGVGAVGEKLLDNYISNLDAGTTSGKQEHGGGGAKIPTYKPEDNSEGSVDENKGGAEEAQEETGEISEPTIGNGSVVYDAEQRLAEMIDKLRSGRTSYSDRLDEMINNYMARDNFKYDPNADMLYQNYLAGMQNAGQMAMKDTMGQAAMLTGGYGSSYATAAANGAYNNYLQKANEALPDFYNIAANAYDREGDNLLSQINLLRNQDNEEYNRYVDALKTELSRENELYDRQQADYESQLKALEAATAGINNMTPAQENAVMSGVLSAAEGTGGMEAAKRYLSGLTGYNLSPDFADRAIQYVEQNSTTIRVVKDKRNNSKDVFTDGTYDENGKLKTWTAKELFEQGAITKKQYEDLDKADLKEGMTYTLLF